MLEYDTKEFKQITIMLEQRDFHFLTHFHLPARFPKEKPHITLQSIYHMTPQGYLYEEVLDEIPYNPKWSIQHMVKTFLAHIMEKAVHKFQKNSVKINRYQ